MHCFFNEKKYQVYAYKMKQQFFKNYKPNFLNNCKKNYRKSSYFSKILFSYKFSKISTPKLSTQDISTFENISIMKIKKFGYFEKKRNFPTIWSIEERYRWLYSKKKFSSWGDLEISSNSLKIKYKGFGGSDEDAAAIRTNNFIPNNLFLFYFEIKIISIGKKGFIGIGLCGENESLDRLPGWEKNSLGYHGDDGFIFRNSGTGYPYGPYYIKNDVIGLCLNFLEKSIFFTKNGSGLNFAFLHLEYNFLNKLYPLVGLRTKGETVSANFGMKPFEFDINFYKSNFQNYLGRKIFLYKINPFYNIKYFSLIFKKKNRNNEQFYSKFFFLNEIIKKKKTHNNEIQLLNDLYIKNYKRSFFSLNKMIEFCNKFTKKKKKNSNFRRLLIDLFNGDCFKLKMLIKINNFFKNLEHNGESNFFKEKFFLKLISEKLEESLVNDFSFDICKIFNPNIFFEANTNSFVLSGLKEKFSTFFFSGYFKKNVFKYYNSKSKKIRILHFSILKFFKFHKFLNYFINKKFYQLKNFRLILNIFKTNDILFRVFLIYFSTWI